MVGNWRNPRARIYLNTEKTVGATVLDDLDELIAENRALRNALNEVITNGHWTHGEQLGDWKISKEVYEIARYAVEQKGD